MMNEPSGKLGVLQRGTYRHRGAPRNEVLLLFDSLAHLLFEFETTRVVHVAPRQF